MIIQNAIKITEGDKDTYLISKHRHDFVSHELQNGEYVSVDGGLEYIRRINPFEIPVGTTIEDWSLSKDSDPVEIRNKLLWGTRGKDGLQQVAYLPIKSFSKEHLEALVKYPVINPLHRYVAQYWFEKKTQKP